MKKSLLISSYLLFSLLVWADEPVVTVAENFHTGGSVEIIAQSGDRRTCTIEAVPASAEYKFLYWADNTALINPVRDIEFDASSEDMTYRAVFVKIADVEFENGAVNVVLTSNTPIPVFNLTAQPIACAELTQWSNASFALTQSYTAESSNITPSFRTKEMLHRTNFGAGGTISISPIECGFQLSATPETGYRFTRWEDNSTSLNREIDYDVNFAETTFTAYFTDGKVRGDANYYQTIAEALDADATTIELLEDLSTEDVVIAADKSITMIGNSYSIGNLTIANGGELTLDGDLQCANLYLNTTTGSSSQLHNAVNLQYTQAYIDVTFEAGSVASPDKWYCLGVPFEVDVATGIKRASSEAACVSGTDYLCWYYDGQYRADTQDGWMIMRSGTMHPGQAYIIGIDGTENTWRFEKKSGAALVQNTNTFNLESYTSAATNITHHNWNTLGNNQLQYISVDGATYVYVYDNEYSYFKNLEADDVSLVVGCPFFVQGTTTVTLVAEDKGPGKRYISPRISESQQSIRMSLTDGKTIDYLYLSTHDDATNDYEIGRDLVKIQAANVAQLWTMAYGYSLAAYDQVPEDNRIIPLTMSAPRNGIYTLSSDRVGDNDVYLLQDNQVLCNLREASYDLELQKGQHTNYVLQINKRQAIVTDVDNTSVDENLGARKFIYHGNLYINHNGKVYTITGELL